MSDQLSTQLQQWEARYAAYKADFESDGNISADEAAILDAVATKLAILRSRIAPLDRASSSGYVPTPEPTTTPSYVPTPEPMPTPALPASDNPYRDQVLQNGSTGAAAKHLQKMLVDRGASIAVDGIFGPMTGQAVSAFQKSAGLTANGIVGPETWQALEGGQGSAASGAPSPAATSEGPNGTSTGAVPATAGGPTPADGVAPAVQTASVGVEPASAPPVQAGASASATATDTSTPDGEVEVDTEYATFTKDGIEFKVGKDLAKEAYNKVIARPYGVPVVLQFGAEIKIEFKVPVKKAKGITGASVGITAGAKAGLAAGLVNAGFEGRVPDKGIEGDMAKYLNLNIFGNFGMATTASTGVKLEKDQWVAELFRLEVTGGFAVGVQAADIVEQYKFSKFSLGSLSIGWSENGKAFVKAESAGESSEMTAVLEDLIRKVKAKIGEKAEDLVDKHAPQGVKDATDKAVQWGAESEGGKQVADTTQDALDAMDAAARWSDENLGTDFGEPGKDLGNDAEEAVRDFCDPGGETSQEATDRVNEENRRFDISHTDFVDTMTALGLRSPGGQLVPYRTAEEYNAVVDEWQKESEVVAKGGEPSGKWKSMATQLRATALARWKKKTDEVEAKKREEQKRKSEEEEKRQQQQQELQAARHEAQMSMGKCNGCNAKGIPITPAATPVYSRGFAKYSEAEAASASDPARAITLYHEATAAFREGDTLQG